MIYEGPCYTEIKVHKLWLGRYLFNRYTFVPIRFKYVHFKYEYLPLRYQNGSFKYKHVPFEKVTPFVPLFLRVWSNDAENSALPSQK